MKSTWLVTVLVMILCLAPLVAAQDTGDTEGAPADLEETIDGIVEEDDGSTEDPAEEVSAFPNPAYARRVENLALKLATETDEDLAQMLDDVKDKADAYHDLKDQYEELKNDPNATEEQIQAAEDAMDAAHEALLESREAALEQLAEATATHAGEIEAMREAGMGWGQIAHALGIHPGALGLGHYKKGTSGLDVLDDDPVEETPEGELSMTARKVKMKNTYRNNNRFKTKNALGKQFAGVDQDDSSSEEVAAATQRDVKTGGAKGHGGGNAKGGNSDGGSGSDGGVGDLSGPGNSAKSGITGKAASASSSKSKNSNKSNNGKAKGKNK